MKDEKEESAEAALTGCLITLLTLPIGVVVKAIALRSLWLWFVVPLGLPPISAPHAFGLAILFAVFTPKSGATDHNKTALQRGIEGVAVSILGPVLAMLAGYLVLLAM